MLAEDERPKWEQGIWGHIAESSKGGGRRGSSELRTHSHNDSELVSYTGGILTRVSQDLQPTGRETSIGPNPQSRTDILNGPNLTTIV